MGLSAATGAVMDTTPAVADSAHVYSVVNTDGEGVWLHSDPGLGDTGDLIRVMPEGTQFDADCYVTDTSVDGNPVWLHGQDDSGATGYFADRYSSSHWGSSNTLQQQGLPICGQAPSAQPASPDLPPIAFLAFLMTGRRLLIGRVLMLVTFRPMTRHVLFL
jgi:hypothetical protein